MDRIGAIRVSSSMTKSAMHKKSAPQPLVRAVEHGIAPRALAPLTRFALPTGLAVGLAMALAACGSATKSSTIAAEREGVSVGASDAGSAATLPTTPTNDYAAPAGGTGTPNVDQTPPPPVPAAVDAGAPNVGAVPTSRVNSGTPTPPRSTVAVPPPMPQPHVAGGLRAVQPSDLHPQMKK
jgi:hypothetical protein